MNPEGQLTGGERDRIEVTYLRLFKLCPILLVVKDWDWQHWQCDCSMFGVLQFLQSDWLRSSRPHKRRIRRPLAKREPRLEPVDQHSIVTLQHPKCLYQALYLRVPSQLPSGRLLLLVLLSRRSILAWWTGANHAEYTFLEFPELPQLSLAFISIGYG